MKRKNSLVGIVILAIAALIGTARKFQPADATDGATPTAVSQRTTSADEVSAADATPKASAQLRTLSVPRYESPRGGQVIKRTGYTLSYDADYKTPQWVGWTLTAEQAQGGVPREDDFQPDPDVKGAKAYTTDYKNSGYDRGHICPAGDMKWSLTAMRESFYLSNICPQNRNLNRGDWKELEELEREWAITRGSVCITAGPIYEKKRPARIGANKVAVPDAFFKVVLVDYPKKPKAYAFVFRNAAGNHPLTYYQLSVNELERRTGMDFFPGLSEKVEDAVPALP